jgi:IS30 family transposase
VGAMRPARPCGARQSTPPFTPKPSPRFSALPVRRTPLRAIAKALGRNPATISRELKRNADHGTYRPAKAQGKADQRCWKGARLDRDDALRKDVLGALKRGWSPEQVAGWLSARAGKRLISHESIYRFLYAQMRRSNDTAWRNYLPRARARRGRRGRQGGSTARTFKDRVSIAKRPASVASRLWPGHWEADLMAFSKTGQNILLAHERKTRFIFLDRQPAKRSDGVIATLQQWLASLPPRLRRTMTFDNGSEFALHHRLGANLGVKTFFCDPHSPWQKGGIENAIGRLRRFLPRKTDLAALSAQDLREAADRYNTTPRKTLGWKTPAEAFSRHLKPLHFNCESTPPLFKGRKARCADRAKTTVSFSALCRESRFFVSRGSMLSPRGDPTEVLGTSSRMTPWVVLDSFLR